MTACTPYPIEKQYRKEAARELDVASVQAHPESASGKVVIWGGSIIDIANDSSGCELTILETPLDQDGYPLSDSYSRGRFKAAISGFMDPLVFKQGVRVTLAGKITGIEKGKLGQVYYAYPKVDILQLRYWQSVPSYYYGAPYYNYPWGGWYGWPYYGGYWYWGYPGWHHGVREFYDFRGGVRGRR
jgi:outer membrane lipoprotein